jgi:type VI protein secretion system component Hcp
MLALQRRAGNASTAALLRRARDLADQAPITLTLTGVVDGATVSSWSLDHDMGGGTTGLEITRPIDADSPVLAKSLSDGAPVDGRLVVQKLTPLGWVRQLTVRMTDCLVDSFLAHEDYESLRLSFSRVRVER